MGHEIQGVIVVADRARGIAALLGAPVAQLDAGFAFVPLTDSAFDALCTGEGGEAPPGFRWLIPKVSAMLAEVSRDTPLAWVETEYFGGIGAQAAALFVSGQRAWVEAGPGFAIDRALRDLGVVREVHRDEFDVVGLGRYRSMELFDRVGDGG